MSKYIDAEKVISEVKRYKNKADERLKIKGRTFGEEQKDVALQNLCGNLLHFVASLQQGQDMGEVSDGYHTFNELYYYRMLYNAAFFNLLPKGWVHKSKRHHTGEECFGGGWFIVMADLPTGQVSNHYELKDWDLFKVPEKEFADEWDGHTPQEAAERIHKYLTMESPEVAYIFKPNMTIDEMKDSIYGKRQEQPEPSGYDKALLEVKSKVDKLYEEASIGLSEYDSGLYNGIAETCMKLRGFIKARLDSDEQPEVDLEEEINRFWDSCIKHKNERGGNVIWSNKLEVEVLIRHFYELGLKARKEK